MSETLPQPLEQTLTDGLSKVLEQWAQVRMAHEAVMLEDAQAVLAQNRKSVASLPTQLQTQTMAEIEPDEGKMGVHIGDIVYTAPAASQSPASAVVAKAAPEVAPSVVAPVAPSQAASTGSSLIPTLLKAGLAAALLGGGAAIPFVPSILGGIVSVVLPSRETKPEPVAPSVQIGGKKYQLRLEQE